MRLFLKLSRRVPLLTFPFPDAACDAYQQANAQDRLAAPFDPVLNSNLFPNQRYVPTSIIPSGPNSFREIIQFSKGYAVGFGVLLTLAERLVFSRHGVFPSALELDKHLSDLTSKGAGAPKRKAWRDFHRAGGRSHHVLAAVVGVAEAGEAEARAVSAGRDSSRVPGCALHDEFKRVRRVLLGKDETNVRKCVDDWLSLRMLFFLTSASLPLLPLRAFGS